jgi:hypothetical protein
MVLASAADRRAPHAGTDVDQPAIVGPTSHGVGLVTDMEMLEYLTG